MCTYYTRLRSNESTCRDENFFFVLFLPGDSYCECDYLYLRTVYARRERNVIDRNLVVVVIHDRYYAVNTCVILQ